MILLIDNYDSFTYNLYQMISAKVIVVRNDAITLDSIAELSPEGIVLSPGPGTPDNSGICLDLIHRFSGSIPILGICLGHQAIAQSFGGKVIQSPDIVHGKKAAIYHAKERLFANMPDPFNAGRYHSLIVEQKSLPSCFTIDAHTKQGELMAISHAKHSTFGIQFHPESILTENGETLLNQFLTICKERP
jgi:anthranilate synthase/aminodeoxychorismate synthase-like glutamine amidotransferase